MNIFLVEINFNLVVVYYNNGKPKLFMINVTLFDFKDQLEKINDRLNCEDTRRPINVEYCCLLINLDGRVWFTHMKLQTDYDVRMMFSIYGLYSSKRSFDFDTTLMRFVHVIQTSMIYHKT